MHKPFLFLALIWPFVLLACSPATEPAATVVLLAPTTAATSAPATATPTTAPTAADTPTPMPTATQTPEVTPTVMATATATPFTPGTPPVDLSATSAAAATFAPLPATRTATPPLRIVSARDAANYYNQTLTVEGKVASTYKSERVIWLIMGTNQKTDFKVVIFPEDWSKFSQVPDVLFRGKTLRATGKVQAYLNAPEMIVKEPRAIIVVQ